MDELFMTFNRRKIIYSIISGLLFILLTLIGEPLAQQQHLFFNIPILFKSLGIGIIIFVLQYLFFTFLDSDRKEMGNKESKQSELFDKLSNIIYKLNFIQIFGLIFISMLPALIAFYPGILAYDSPSQITQYSTGHYFQFNPIFHTLIIALFLKLGNILFHSYTLGVFFYTIFQMSILSISFTMALLFIKRNIKNSFIFIFSLLFFMLFPLNHLFSVNMTKDVLFAAVFLLIFIYLAYFFNKDEYTFSFVDFLSLSILFVLLSLLRPNGLYLIFFLLVLLFIFSKIKKLHLVLIFTITMTLTFGINNFLIAQTNAVVLGEMDTYSMFLQQIARAKVYNPKSFTPGENKKFNYLFDARAAKIYKPAISDPIKGTMKMNNIHNYSSRGEFLKDFFSLWATIGIKNLGLYTESFLLGHFSYWYPGAPYPIVGAEVHKYVETEWHRDFPELKVYENKKTNILKNYYYYIGKNDIQRTNNPIKYLLTPGIYLWIMFLSIIHICYTKHYKFIYPIFLLIGLFLSLFFGPVALSRYIYPIIISTPITIVLVLLAYKSRGEVNNV